MPVLSSQWNLRRAAIAGAVLTMPFATPAQAQQAAEQFYDGVMSAIGFQKERPPINYRERSPLVVPRDSTLPPPQSSAVNAANWPVDPEVKQARALAVPNDGLTSSQRFDQGTRRLLPSEIERGRTSRPQNNPGVSSDDIGRRSTWSELGYKGGLFSKMFNSREEESAKFTGERPRATLVAPPSGYQTPSPNQPYGLSKEVHQPKAQDYLSERGTTVK